MRKLPRVLVVEDEPSIAELIAVNLRHNGFAPTVVFDGVAAQREVDAVLPDVILLDWMLPGESGASLARGWRKNERTKTIPILMLTARSDESDKVQGLDAGADDYITKPFSTQELLARIRALLRRREGSEPVAASERRRLQFGALVIDSAMREAWLGEQGIELTSAEFDLLWLLTANAGRILSREEIFNALRGIEYDGQDRSIDVRISRIRPKIGDDPMHPRLIKTVRSKGYLFVAEAAEALL